jgi:hypothetical protein
MSVEELRALGAKVRAEAEAAGELAKPGSPFWDIPQDVRDALLDDLHSGAYDERLRSLIIEDED